MMAISNARFSDKNQFSSVQSRDRPGCQGDMRDDSAQILFQSFLQDALESCSGMDRDVHSLIIMMCSFLCHFFFGAQGPLHEIK